ncbi:zinc finger protein 26-like [Cloeon dipterum]|uniref:zinc finger protein 26-like n=1 Tax=Cloeon dipterum TaxID=197152 RepID=UPI00321FB89F
MDTSRGIPASAENDSLVDLDSLCRICAQCCTEGGLEAAALTQDRIKRLKSFLRVDFGKESDILPRQLCHGCANVLDQWSNTQLTVKRANEFFEMQLQLRGEEFQIAKVADSEEIKPRCEKCLKLSEGESRSQRKRRTTAVKSQDSPQPPVYFSDNGDDSDYVPVSKKTKKSKKSASKGRSLNPPFSCSHCEEQFESLDSLISHQRTLRPGDGLGCRICAQNFSQTCHLLEHTGEHQRLNSAQVAVLFCDECSEGPFASRASLQTHLTRSHLKAFPCGLCGLGFDELVDFSKHVQTHINFRHFPCALCGCRFTKLAYLLEHTVQHASAANGRQITFACEICPDQVFSSKHNLASHMTKKHRSKGKERSTAFLPLSEQAGQQLECGVCSEVLGSCQALADHMAEQHAKFKLVACKRCGCKFTRLPYYLEHVAEHVAHPDKVLSVRCEACPEIFSSKHNLSKHVYKKHRNNYPAKQGQDGTDAGNLQAIDGLDAASRFKVEQDAATGLYPCRSCAEKFKSAAQLNAHLLQHVPDKCPTCRRIFEDREALRVHLQDDCCRRRPEKFPCPVCGKLLATRQSLRVHASLHTGERKFVCEVCAKSYRTQSALAGHRNVVHLQQAQYMCHICARTFSFKLALKRHVMLHVGDLPHRCTMCERAFVTANLLKIHKAKEHERRVLLNCSACCKGFVDMVGLRRHMRAVCKLPEADIPYVRDRQFVRRPTQN